MQISRLPSADPVAQSYQLYFTSGVYDRRYPGPNRTTCRCILVHLPPNAHVIDYGCGSGRYLLCLQGHVARAAGYDISPAAMALVRRRADEIGWHDLAVVGPDAASLDRYGAQAGPADMVMCLFGVLGHIADPGARMRALRQMRRLLTPETGRLVLSVPNRRRRFGREQRAAGPGAAGLVLYRRSLGAAGVTLPYQLFDPERLRRELAEAGFTIQEMRAESVFPESWLLNSAAVRWLDGWLTRFCPAAFGYGILAVARP